MQCLVACLLLAASPTDDWEESPATRLSPSVHITDDVVTLRNRGLIVSQRSYDDATVSCVWTWTKGDERGQYQDHLCVVFGTDGNQRRWAQEIQYGILVRLNPGSGGITVEQWQKDKDDGVRLGSKEGFTFARDTGYDVRIVAAQGKLTVSINGKQAITVDLPKAYRGGKVAIYNREAVAGIVKESTLAKLTIE